MRFRSWPYAGVGIALSAMLTPASAREANAVALTSRGAERAVSPTAHSALFRAELALRWAPIHHQDVSRRGSHALDGAADYIAAYDFDGDLNGRNNWDNAGDPRYPLSAHAYFSVVETASHWFVSYTFFHPRDWSSSFFETEHENDAEGLLLAVLRDGSRYGALRAAVTVAHRDFYSYVPAGSNWTSGAEDVDGELRLMAFEGQRHPVTAQQAEGHGLKAWPHYDIHGDGVVYFPSLSKSETPAGPDDPQVLYRLRDVLEPGGLWDSRSDPALFGRYGSFAGDASHGCGAGALLCTIDAANAPWGFNDNDDGCPRGTLASDPAALLKAYFRIPEAFSLNYAFNPFRGPA